MHVLVTQIVVYSTSQTWFTNSLQIQFLQYSQINKHAKAIRESNIADTAENTDDKTKEFHG